jgi:hypothetical protein
MKVVAWVGLSLFATTGGVWGYAVNYGLVPRHRNEPIGVSISPGGKWQLRTYAYEDLGGATGHTYMWAEVKAQGSSHWRRVYDGFPASVSWTGPNTVVFAETGSSDTHTVDVRSGDYGVTPHGPAEEILAWAQIVGLPLVLLAIGGACIVFVPRIIGRKRRSRAQTQSP